MLVFTGLLRLVHLLGNYDYATGGPVGGDAAAFASADAGGWTPTRRLALLSALCELAMDTNALRNSLDETVETRKKFRMEAIALRSKARQLRVRHRSMHCMCAGNPCKWIPKTQCKYHVVCLSVFSSADVQLMPFVVMSSCELCVLLCNGMVSTGGASGCEEGNR